jgi:hypothetical protein
MVDWLVFLALMIGVTPGHYSYLPIVGITRYIGAQDETTGKYQDYYAPGQITKISLRWDLIENSAASTIGMPKETTRRSRHLLRITVS